MVFFASTPQLGRLSIYEDVSSGDASINFLLTLTCGAVGPVQKREDKLRGERHI